jgi:hypothetical protein
MLVSTGIFEVYSRQRPSVTYVSGSVIRHLNRAS